MAHLQWRKYKFFERDDKIITDDNLVSVLRQLPVCCTASGKGYICLGCTDGTIHLLDRGFEHSAFQAYSGEVFSMQQLRLTNLLITHGKEADSQIDVIKVFNLDKFDQGQPACMRTLKAHPAKDPAAATKLTAFCVHENLTLLAAGFADGYIVLYRGDVSKDSGKTKIFEDRPKDAITNLFFRQVVNLVYLYVTTETKIWTCIIDSKHEYVQKLENDKGCEAKCAVMSDASQDNQLG